MGGGSLEILTAAGESCGTVTGPMSAEGGRTVRRIDIGQDGTVVQTEYAVGGGCVFRWWPALLR